MELRKSGKRVVIFKFNLQKTDIVDLYSKKDMLKKTYENISPESFKALARE